MLPAGQRAATVKAMIRIAAALTILIALTAPAHAQAAKDRSLPPKPAIKAPQSAVPPPPSQNAPPPAPPQDGTASACMTRLSSLGLDVRPAPTRSDQSGSCTIIDPIIVTGIHPVEAKDPNVALPDSPLLSCAIAEAFGAYVRDIVIPLARGIYDRPVAAIGTGPGFECRTRNHVPGAKISAHAQGNAIDIAQITLADHTKIGVEKPDDERGRRLIFGLRAAGCGAFSTALGPGSDAAHATHLHFDIEARGRDGKSKFCQ